jgi:S-adenosylmethionine-dependent methyltransferase
MWDDKILAKTKRNTRMNDDVSDIAASYNRDPQREDNRLDRHQLEYDLTWRCLDQYLPPQGSILEIGAATGRYTLELARRGYAVTAVDLSEGLLETCRQKLAVHELEGKVRLIVADARDLSAVTEKSFDAVLLMGPLYHLVMESDRKMALQEAFGHLKEGGVLFSAFISRFGILGDLLRDHPEWIEEAAEVQSILEQGRDPDDYPRGGFRGYFARPSEIIPLHEEMGFDTLALAGVEPAISADDESYNRLAGNQRRQWLDLFHAVSREPSILGASRHLLHVGRKRRAGEQ